MIFFWPYVDSVYDEFANFIKNNGMIINFYWPCVNFEYDGLLGTKKRAGHDMFLEQQAKALRTTLSV